MDQYRPDLLLLGTQTGKERRSERWISRSTNRDPAWTRVMTSPSFLLGNDEGASPAETSEEIKIQPYSRTHAGYQGYIPGKEFGNVGMTFGNYMRKTQTAGVDGTQVKDQTMGMGLLPDVRRTVRPAIPQRFTELTARASISPPRCNARFVQTDMAGRTQAHVMKTTKPSLHNQGRQYQNSGMWASPRQTNKWLFTGKTSAMVRSEYTKAWAH